MKKYVLWLMSTIVFFSCTPKEDLTIAITVEKDNELITISRDELTSLFQRELAPNERPLLIQGGAIVPFQFNESNGDWYSASYFIQQGEHQLKLVAKDIAELPDVDPKVNIRFGIRPDLVEDFTTERLKSNDSPTASKMFQMEGPAWENDLVAFRNYYDARNGMDIFGKKTHEMVLDKVGAESNETYHQMEDWGMDILKVGNSLGAGAIALQIGDTLYRVGGDCKGTVTKIVDGPLLAKLVFAYEGWSVAGKTINIQHAITLKAGNRYFESEVTVQADGKPFNGSLVTGLVNLHNDSLYTWEAAENGVYATFDAQAYKGEKLGMAIVAAKANIAKTAWATEEGEGITQTHLVYFEPNEAGVFNYKLYSCWEYENTAFASIEGFKAFMLKDAAE